jgi:TPR repeat protein
MYYVGEGIPENNIEGFRWLHLAATQGDARAQAVLGKLYYERGLGLSKDNGEALKWLRLSIAQGFSPAQETIDKTDRSGKAKSKGLPK